MSGVIQIDDPGLEWDIDSVSRSGKKNPVLRVVVYHPESGYRGEAEGKSLLLTKQKAWVKLVLNQQEIENRVAFDK